MTHSDSGQSGDKILKRDVRGRVRTSVRRREELMDEYERSGLTGPKFAEVAGVCYQTFAGWMQKRRRARGDCASSAVMAPSARQGAAPLIRWLEADTEAGGEGTAAAQSERTPDGRTSLAVILPGGVRAELNHAAQIPLLAELARQLNAHPGRPC